MSKPTGMCFPFLAMCVAAMVRIENGELRIENCEAPSGRARPQAEPPSRIEDCRTEDKGQKTKKARTKDKGRKAGISQFSILNSQFSILNFPVAVITGFIAVYSQTHAEGYDVRTLFTAPFLVRALNALKSLGLYIFKTIIPFDLHIDCRWPTPTLPADGWGTILAAVVGLAMLGFWFIRALRIENGELRMENGEWRIENCRAPSGRARSPSAPPSRIEDCRTEDKGQKTEDDRTEDKGQRRNSQFSILNSQFSILLFFLFAIAPTLGIFGSFGREARADRFTYIPAMAISMAIAAALKIENGELRIENCEAPSGRARSPSAPPSRIEDCRTEDRRQRTEDDRTEDKGQRHNSQFSILLPLVIIYAASTLTLIPTIRNDYTAFSRVLACDPIHPRALSHVASEECARFRNLDAGIGHFRDSLACEWNRDTACQLAFALATRGRREDVADIRALGETTGIAKHPESDRKGLMAEALGMAALKDMRWSDASVFFAAAVRAPARLYPSDDAYARLGVALANGGRHKEAQEVFSALVRPRARVRESVRAFAERSLEQLAASQGGRIMLFY